MSHYTECEYCTVEFRPEDGTHVCEVENLHRVIDDLREQLEDAGEMLAGEDA